MSGAVAQLPPQFQQRAQYRTDTATVTTGAFLALAWLTISLRFWVRGLLIRSIGWDDWTMLLTIFTYTAYCAEVFVLNTYNPRLMMGLLEVPEYIPVFKHLVATIALYIATTVIFKIALGLFFLRIMVEKWQRLAIYTTVGFSTVFGIAYWFFAVFQCGSPTDFLKNELTGNCVGWTALYPVNLTAGLVNAIADWILALLPIFLLHKTQMPLPGKISAGGLMMLGAAGSIASVIRLFHIDAFKPGVLFFWKQNELTNWSIIECGICIITACLATLRPLFKCCMDTARGMTTRKSRSGHSGPTEISESSGVATWSSRSNPKRDSFLPLSDLSNIRDSTLSRDAKKPQAFVQDNGRITEVVNAHVNETNAARAELSRQDAARKVKALELARIAREQSPEAFSLHGHRAQQRSGSSLDNRYAPIYRDHSAVPDWD